jgi:hypothetical protein
MRHLQRVYCAFAGHQYWLGRGTDRLFLKCSQCGRETAGILVGAEEEPPRTGWFRRTPARRHDGAAAHAKGAATPHH